MSREKLKEIADQLIENCRTGNEKQGLSDLYDPGAISVEAMVGPGASNRETVGVEAIQGKHEWWANTFKVHSSNAEGPFLHGDDRFAVIFSFEATNRETSERTAMKEVAIYTVSDGKIIREEFYY